MKNDHHDISGGRLRVSPGTARTSGALALCLCLGITGLLLTACKHEEARATRAIESQTFALTSINGSQVPAQISHEGTALEVRSGMFSIKPDGTCSTMTVFVPPSGIEVTNQATASYTREGSKLRMLWKNAGTTFGSVQGDTFTMTNEGMIFVYKQ